MKSPSFPPFIGGYPPADEPGRARVSVPARPVHPLSPCARPTDAAQAGRPQSAGDFAGLDRWVARAQRANRRSDRVLTHVSLAIAAVAFLWMVLPAVLMALAGGTPA